MPRGILPVLFLFVYVQFIFGKSMGDPGEAGGSGNEIGPNSGTALSRSAYINQLTGMPAYSVKLMRMVTNSGFNLDVDFSYGIGSTSAMRENNLLEPTDWLGLGWHTGFSYIYSADTDTGLGDEKFYYVYSNGIVSEIVRTNDGKYRIKNDPYWHVKKNVTPALFCSYDLITGWEVTKTDGSKFVYGESDTASKSADHSFWPKYDTTGHLKKISCSGGILLSAYYQYKRWNLKYGQDVNGSRIRFKYAQILDSIHTPHEGVLEYVRESHVKEAWADDNGDHFIFTTAAKDTNEYNAMLSDIFADYHETRYLRSIKMITKGNVILDSVYLTYTGDAGQLPHLYGGTANAKRLLVRITSTKSDGNANRVFEYGRGPIGEGLMQRIHAPINGNSISYGYDLQSIYQIAGGVQERYSFPVVTKLTTYDGVNTKPALITNYVYPTNSLKQRYVAETGMCFWGEVSSNSGTGEVTTMYDINPANHAFGFPRTITMRNTGGQVVSLTNNAIGRKSFFFGTDTFYYNSAVEIENEQNGVKVVTGLPICALNDSNGVSALTYKTNSDGIAVATKSKFAFENYPSMGHGTGKTGQVDAVAGTYVLETDGAPADCITSNAKVIRATFTTWARSGALGPYRPHKTYAWKADSAHYPESTFVAFDTAAPTAHGWTLTGEITKYSRFGNVLETKSPTDYYSSTIYRSDYNLPIASVSNAPYDECAVFTCDYDADTAGYFDYENGWGKGGAQLMANWSPHFGTYCIGVGNNYGPTRNIKFDPNKDHIYSAWLGRAPGEFGSNSSYVRMAVELHSAYPGVGTIIGSYDSVDTNLGFGWKLYVHQIKRSRLQAGLAAGKTPADIKYVRIWLGNKPGETACSFHVDDIRFYPADALITTTYYTQKWRKAMLSVGANNNPGNLVKYDTFGRLVNIYKIDKTKYAADTSFKKMLMAKEYHMMGDDLRLLAPNGYEELAAGTDYAISWQAGAGTVDTGGVDLRYFDGSAWTTIANGIKGSSTHVWRVPGTAKTGCRVAVLSRASSAHKDTSDTSFVILSNRCPGTPVLKAPMQAQEVALDTVELKWDPITDPDGDSILYRVEVSINDGLPVIVKDNFAGTQHRLPLNAGQYGFYNWRVSASDGTCRKNSEGRFLFVPDSFYVIRDIQSRMVSRIERTLFDSIRVTLTDSNKVKFSHSYRDSTSMPGYRVFVAAAYFVGNLSEENSFCYKVYHTENPGSGDDNWLEPVCEGQGAGFTDVTGGGGCETPWFEDEMRCIYIHAMNPNPPAMTFTFKHDCPDAGQMSFTWGELAWTRNHDDAIMAIKWTAANGYHTWYKAHHRGAGSSGWKSDGQWTGTGSRKVDKIWLNMFVYNP